MLSSGGTQRTYILRAPTNYDNTQPYRLMLGFSLRGDVMMAQLTMKNIVLLTSVLILTYGLYVPKSWRRAALVVGPLALLPFATLLALAVGHPHELRWLWEGWSGVETPRALLFTFDAAGFVCCAYSGFVMFDSSGS